jgi:hypothetical protein
MRLLSLNSPQLRIAIRILYFKVPRWGCVCVCVCLLHSALAKHLCKRHRRDVAATSPADQYGGKV